MTLGGHEVVLEDAASPFTLAVNVTNILTTLAELKQVHIIVTSL